MKYDIWSPAEEKLHALYGDEIPALIVERYRREKRLMRDTEIEMLLAFLWHFAARCHEIKAPFALRGRFGTSLVCWLLGITEVNPLPAHDYCPHCKRVQFVSEEKYGWDLPEKICGCGTEMQRDGMNTVFLPEVHSPKPVHIAVDIPGELMDEVQAQLLSFFPDRAFIRGSFKDDDMVRYFFLRKTKGDESGAQKRITCMSYRDAQEQAGSYASILFLNSPADSLLWELCRETGAEPHLTECFSADTLKAYFQYTLPGAFYDNACDNAALIKKIRPARFSVLLSLLGFDHATIEGQEEIKAHIQACPQALCDYDFFCEDIYDRIRFYLEKNGIRDDRLACETADKARAGKFLRFGVDEVAKNCFVSLGIPDAYIDYLKRIRYIFPRGHMLAILLRNLRLAWFYLNEPSAWADTPAAVSFAQERAIEQTDKGEY